MSCESDPAFEAGPAPTSEAVTIAPYEPGMRSHVLELSIRTWGSVFAQMREDVPRFVYDSFYPRGWEVRQEVDLAAVLDEHPEQIDVALVEHRVVGWVCTRMHPEDLMGEVYVLAVDPEFQRRGVAGALLDQSFDRIRSAGMCMAMVETGGDSGHAASRAAYESVGFERWPVARYFKDLRSDSSTRRFTDEA